MVKCLECEKEFKQITNRHLKFAHNLTTFQYKEKYPDSELFDKKILEFFSERSKKANELRKGVSRSESIKQKIKDTKSKQIIVPWNKGIAQTKETKDKLSQSGILRHRKWHEQNTHPQVGLKLPKETKEKISQSMISYARKNTDELKERAKNKKMKKKQERKPEEKKEKPSKTAEKPLKPAKKPEKPKPLVNEVEGGKE